jgi:CheY-like chemotaxis protein
METNWQVLVIEDDELDRALVAELFCLRGRGRVVVTEAPTLKVGLDLVATSTFDLVLLDTKLPDASAPVRPAGGGRAGPDHPHSAAYDLPRRSIRQAARQRGAYEVVVRGELNPLWAGGAQAARPGADRRRASRRLSRRR